ncbi:MAG: hypothetical protein QG623_608 [Patescibacteria group bacterium]|nr:hypothetical protein [Patescibacteria group bacterium]
MGTLKSRCSGPGNGHSRQIPGSTLIEEIDKPDKPDDLVQSGWEITAAQKPELKVAMSTANRLGASAKDCVSQDTGVVPPEMRAAQLAEASRRENFNQSGDDSEHEELCSD